MNSTVGEESPMFKNSHAYVRRQRKKRCGSFTLSVEKKGLGKGGK